MGMGCLYRRKKKLADGTMIEVGPYWMKWYRNGTPYSESTHTEKKSEAERELKKRIGDVARGVPLTSKVGRVKFDEMIENLCNEYQANDRRSLDVLRIRCNKHLLPFFGGRRASTITTADIDRYIVVRQSGEASPEAIQRELEEAETEYAAAVQSVRTRTDLARSAVRKELRRLKHLYLVRIRETKQKAGASNGTINRELAALQRSYTLAVQARLLMAKPYIRTLSENNVRTGFFEREHFTSIHRHLPDYLRPVATVAYITGWRTISELLPLEWRQVDFNGGTLRLDPGTTKNGDGRVFPLTQELRTVLLDQRAKTDELQRKLGVLIPVVFHIDGKPFKSYRKAWKTACRKAGLPGRIPHDFRRTAVRNLVRAGVSEVVAMKMTGHKTRSIFDRYDIVSQGDLNDAARKLETLMVTKTVTVEDFSSQDLTQRVEA